MSEDVASRYACLDCKAPLQRFPTRCGSCNRPAQNRRQAIDSAPIPSELERFQSAEAFVEFAFGPDGYFAQEFEGYEPREGQISLSRSIARSLEAGVHVMAEGPCGTGKSMAYLVPAVYMALKHRRNVIVATPVISLQEQLVGKDLPALQALLPFKLTFALLKGRGNYLCQHRFDDWKEERDGRALPMWQGDQEREQAEEEDALISWAKDCTGDRSTMTTEPSDGLWEQVCGSSDDCKCAARKSCHYWKAKEDAFSADVLVSNYHLLFTHLKIRLVTGQDTLLPALDYVIADEAHEMADVARKFFGFELKDGAFTRQAKMLKNVGGAGAEDLSAALTSQAAAVFAGMSARAKQSNSSLIMQPGLGGHADQAQQLLHTLRAAVQFWDRAKEASTEIAERSRGDARMLDIEGQGGAARDMRKGAKVAENRAKAYGRNAERCIDMAEMLAQAANVAPDGLTGKPWVYWLDGWSFGGGREKGRRDRERLTLSGQPTDIAGYLDTTLFRACRGVVLTSATLTTGEQDGFAFIRRDLGFQGTELVVPSPFDFRTQACLVVPGKEEMPVAPSDKAFPDYCATLTRRVITATRGRALCLYTSYKNMTAVRDKLRDLPFTLLTQGDGTPRTKLVEEFKEDVHSVLFGVSSMWQGLDVPGQACVAVIIDKIPFPGPDDPLCAWLERKYDGSYSFRNYSLPRALIKLRQGVGRLIRSRDDYGVVVLLDSRIHTKQSYKNDVLSSLPPIGWIHTSVSEVERFISKKEPVGAAAPALASSSLARPAWLADGCNPPHGLDEECDNCALPF